MNLEEIRFKLRSYEKEISFIDETHEYHIGKEQYISVSTLIKKYSPVFNAEGAAWGTAKKLGITQKEVLAMWERNKELSCIKGTNIHLYAELFTEGVRPYTDKKDEYFYYKKTVENMVGTLFTGELIINEAMLYSKKYKVAGQTDFLLYDDEKESIIVGDYKTNANIRKKEKYNKNMLGILRHLKDTDIVHYEIQTSMYRYFLELWGLKCKSQKLVWLNEGVWEIIPCRYLKDEVIAMLEANKKGE